MVRRLFPAFLILVAMAATGAVSRMYVDGMLPASIPADAPDFDDKQLAEALTAVDLSGSVDFEALKKNRKPLDQYVASLAKTSPESAAGRFDDPAEQLAYWLNAYNALTLQALIDRWPGTKSPDDLMLGRFYWGLSWPIGGKRLTLRSILEKKLREGLGDPRALLAVHCGTLSCAPLDTTPYMAETVDGQLNDAVRRFMADQDNVRLDGRAVHLSPMLERYQNDFIAALPEGRSQLLQFVWAFLPEACRDARACLTRGDLDKACGPKLDGCTVQWEPWASAVRAKH
jgi:hypothetical protein